MPYLANSIKILLIRDIFACRIHICDENSSKSYDFHEKCKKIEKWVILVISDTFFRFSLKLLSRILEKVRKYVFLDEKKRNKAKLEIFKLLEKIRFIARL